MIEADSSHERSRLYCQSSDGGIASKKHVELDLSIEQVTCIQQHHNLLMNVVANGEDSLPISALTMIKQWAIDFYQTATSDVQSTTGQHCLSLSSRVICFSVAWEWLIDGTFPVGVVSTKSSPLPSPPFAAWLLRCQKMSFGGLAKHVSDLEQESETLRCQLRRYDEDATSRSSEVRALKKRLVELEQMLKYSSSTALTTSEGSDSVTVSDLKKENQVNNYTVTMQL